MIILVDENMPMAESAFAPFGEVRTAAGRSLSKQQLADVDALLVRSVTQVDESLLKDTPVKFVGTATIGTDHIDQSWLQQAGIGFASAPGSNARSVVEYVMAALAQLRLSRGVEFLSSSVGIIGMGNVGSSLYKTLDGLGINVRAYDPLIPQDRYPVMTCLDEVLEADIVCLHTPLSTEGPYPSYHMLGKQQLAKLRPGTVLLNAGRGAAIDNNALLAQLESGQDLIAVLDVWEGEPQINTALLPRVAIATPHIAGYSYDGKLTATAMLQSAMASFFELQLPFAGVNDKQQDPQLLNLPAVGCYEQLCSAILQAYPIMDDDARLRAMATLNAAQIGAGFDQLRRDYPQRREFTHFALKTPVLSELRAPMKSLGFSLL
ncbi:MAG: 4-phosphoerythronate dehydrogenase [Pseudomonadales bacterium]